MLLPGSRRHGVTVKGEGEAVRRVEHRSVMEVTNEVDPRLEAVIRQLESSVRNGHALEQARRDLLGLDVDQALVDRGVELVRLRMEEIRVSDVPRTMSVEGRESWYLGPGPNDRFWPSLSAHLVDVLDEDSLDDLDRTSTKIVSMLEHPGAGTFRTKGIVLGYVQSGKTTNFTAAIAKAADAGYRLFIVLSGIHDGLRQQTQARLDQQLVALNAEQWIALTDLGQDFRPNVNVNAFLTGNNKVLCVVKKNGTRLRHLQRWLAGAQDAVLRNCPTIIIDDEADQASVNTARDQNRPTTINRRIRQIIETLPKVAYVGYTATPFANILIDPTVEADLYPRDFIVDLPRPAHYVGPETIFGREPLLRDDDDDAAADGLDMVRLVPDDELDSLRPPSRNLDDFTPAITESLSDALHYFLMSTAARRRRGLGNPHATMLLHTTMRVAVHAEFARLVEHELLRISQQLREGDTVLRQALQDQWEDETARVTSGALPPVTFADVFAGLEGVIDAARVIVDNSRSEDRLAYGEDPVTAIAVGGNTLSRGLTLEGLTVSLFVRTSNAYDTLLQMGRWFGYRRGYEDMPRLWMTSDMAEWFRHLATVEREMRHDIERYELERRTPLDFGVRIATHPQLAITSAAKMRRAVRASVSYSGRRLQTIRFRHEDRPWLERNLDAATSLCASALGDGVVSERDDENTPGITVLRSVTADRVIEFLAGYQFSARSYDLNSEAITGYIATQNDVGELLRFTVAVMGRGQGPSVHGSIPLGLDTEVPLIVRSRLQNVPGDEADIKALMSKEDRAIDLAIDERELAALTNGELARLRNSPQHGGRGDGSGLLLLYPVARNSAPMNARSREVREPLAAVEDVIGVGLVFPEAQTTEGQQTYMTADLSRLVVEEPLPEDELDEEPGVERMPQP
jgi:hypothetical protein